MAIAMSAFVKKLTYGKDMMINCKWFTSISRVLAYVAIICIIGRTSLKYFLIYVFTQVRRKPALNSFTNDLT